MPIYGHKFVLLYGCEIWNLTKQQNTRLDVHNRVCSRLIMGVRQSEVHMKNSELYRITSQRQISEIIREQQLQFTGHCQRMPPDEPVNIYALYTSEIATSHRQGRRPQTYLDQISECLPMPRQAGEVRCQTDRQVRQR